MLEMLVDTLYPEGFWQHELVYICRLMLALLLGAMIGIERQWKKYKSVASAGFRTYTLVTVGACVFTLVSVSMPLVAETMGGGIVNNADPSRIAAQVVSGIGFIGAGAIMQSKQRIHGLATAASLWVAAAIGLAVGAGLYLTAVFGTVFTLITLRWFSSLEAKADKMIARRTVCYTEEECAAVLAETEAEHIVLLERRSASDKAKETEL